jgi:hypothetical protein
MPIYNIKPQRDDGLTIPLWEENEAMNQDLFEYVLSQISFRHSYMSIYNIKTQRDNGLMIPLWEENKATNQDLFEYVLSQITFEAFVHANIQYKDTKRRWPDDPFVGGK